MSRSTPAASDPEDSPQHRDPAPDDGGGTTGTDTPTGADGQHKAQNVQRERFRRMLGWVAVVASLGVALFYALATPGPEYEPGSRGAALRWGVPAMWVLLAVTLATWTLRLRERVTIILSYVVVGCFAFYMVLRAW